MLSSNALFLVFLGIPSLWLDTCVMISLPADENADILLPIVHLADHLIFSSPLVRQDTSNWSIRDKRAKARN